MKRIFLLVLTNLAVMLVLSAAVQLLGLDRYLYANGQNLTGLLMVAAIFGFGGAFISLAISKWMAKRAMGVRVIKQAATTEEQWLVNTVRTQAEHLGIGMPEVGIFDHRSPMPSLPVRAVTRHWWQSAPGWLARMKRNEVEAVLGHEMAHVANGDMVTLTLIQGVVNTFVFFLSRVIGDLVDKAVLRNERGRGIGYFVTVMVAQLVLGILANMIVMWFSRWREFRADQGGARTAGTSNMIAALQRLKSASDESALPPQMAAFGIKGGARHGHDGAAVHESSAARRTHRGAAEIHLTP